MKLSATIFLTLDGVYQGPGGPDEDTTGGFTSGGWLAPFIDEDFGTFMDGIFQRPEAFLLGRHTYEIFAAYWPHQSDGTVATKLNELPKYVVSETLGDAGWEGTTVLRSLVDVATLKDRDGGDLQVHGSGALVRELIANDLLDVLRIVRAPILLGEGKRLFGEGQVPRAFRLTEHGRSSSGLGLEVLELAGPATFGDLT